MGILRHNWPWKLVSLGAALALAVFVRKQEDVLRRTLLLPLDVSAPSGQRVIEPPPGTQVRVDLEGPAERVRSIINEGVRLNYDTSRLVPGGRAMVPIKVELPERLRDNVEVDWRPRSVQVRLTSDASRDLPVTVKVEKRLENWELKEVPIAAPSRASVTGPEAA